MPNVFEEHLAAKGAVPMLEGPPLDIQLESDDLAVREALERLVSGLGAWALSTEEIGTVQLVTAEVLNNIVEHAYPDGAAPGPIWLQGRFCRDGLHLLIRDQGKAMPEGQLPLGQTPSVDVDLLDLPEGGFGWFLIQDLAKDVRYCRVGEDNHLHLRIAVTPPRLAAN